MERIDLSDGTFLNYVPNRSMNGSTMLNRYQDGPTQRYLNGIKIPKADILRAFVKISLDEGFEVKEILAELFAQASNYDADNIEYLMRCGR